MVKDGSDLRTSTRPKDLGIQCVGPTREERVASADRCICIYIYIHVCVYVLVCVP